MTTANGLLGDAAAGYRLAWTHRRPLLTVLLPVLAAALITLTALDLLLGRDHAVIINGLPVVPDDDATGRAWAKLLAVPVFWLIGLAAAAVTAAGARHGLAVRPRRALTLAVTRLPILAGAALLAGYGAYLLLRLAAPGGPYLVVAVLAGTAVAAARLLLILLPMLLGRSDRPAGVAAVLLGGLAVPLLVLVLLDETRIPYVGQAAAGALGTVVVAVQAGLLAHRYPVTAEAAARLGLLAGPAARPPWTALAGVVLALLAPAGVAAANPFAAPTVRSHTDVPGMTAALAWPAGGHPVLATLDGARFCDNDPCDRYVDVSGSATVFDGQGSAGIAADGSAVVAAVTSGGMGDGGPFLDYGLCTRAGCRHAYLPARASAREPFGWPEYAAAVGPDHAIWFALAWPAATTYRLVLIRCAQVGCTKPERREAGTVEKLKDDGADDRNRLRLTIGADGRPQITVRTGLEAVTPTGSTLIGEPGSVWTTTPAGTAVSYRPGTIRVGDRLQNLPGGAVPGDSGAVAAAGGHAYATAAEQAPAPGFHVTLGAAAGPAYWRQVLWRCDPAGCRRQTLDGFPTRHGRELMAANPDGRVLIVRQDRILLVSAPA
ncbi:hypothetical protein ACQP2F_23955 [Actinoplanes sp. CA-030573]|uniref:hypothetical protein n=1 Tax=Actinoplanes sp. CA-030573 TaxID=3239898 RepID=UPI003D9131F1